MTERFSRRTRITAATVTALGLLGAGIGTGVARGSGGPNSNPSSTAAKLSAELYNQRDFPKGVPVPGILNGTVTLEGPNGPGSQKITYTDPVLLELPNTLTGLQSLDGVWVGVPDHNEQGHVVLHAMQIHEGQVDGQTESVRLNNPTEPVLDGAAIYPTAVTHAPDELIAFDITGNGNFPSTPVEASVAK